jgi:hypothetical protein
MQSTADSLYFRLEAYFEDFWCYHKGNSTRVVQRRMRKFKFCPVHMRSVHYNADKDFESMYEHEV